MAAYTAVISLLQTLEQPYPELFYGHTAETLDSLHANAEYFLKVLEEANNKSRFDPENVKYLEEKIRVAATDAEDVVELKVCQIIKGSSWKFGIARIMLHRNLLSVAKKMDTTKKEVMEIVSDFSTSTANDETFELSGDSLIGTSSRSKPMLANLEDVIVGLDDDLEIIVKRLTGPLKDLNIVTIAGMGGIGKTTLARKAHDHLSVRYHFDLRIWITISQEYQSRNVLLEALHCISQQTNIVIGKDYDKDDNELADLVQKKLKGPKYLVVVDDIWSTDVWDSIRGIFPDCNNRSRILLTTRETKVATYANPSSPHEINLLNLNNSWKLLCHKVFGQERDHPPELEEIGKEIVKKCQGLPLTISLIGGYLSKVARTLESWKDVARTLGEIIARHPDKCLGVLGLSYHHLPNHLKPCFLSMASFLEDFQVMTCRLIQLWIAEGFIRTHGSGKRLEEVAVDYLEDLVSRNLIMVKRRRFNGEIKTCGMHDLLREFCLKEAEMTKFMHIERTSPTLPTQKYNTRRFSSQTQFHSIDKFCKLPPVARSLYIFSRLRPSATCYNLLGIFPISCRPRVELFTYPDLGPPRFIAVSVFSRFKLLRVLVVFHEYEMFSSFPLAITKLFHLRYLAIKFGGNLPASILELQNLQTLINEKSHEPTTLPGKIWMMTNLRHVHVGAGCYLPNAIEEINQNRHLVVGMPNLEELSVLGFASCTSVIFWGIPNLKRLIICYDHSPNDRRIDMSRLRKLETLKCFSNVLKPRISIKRFWFPTSLKRLTLSGWFEFPWKDISTLATLPNLEELKLKKDAFSGDVWQLSNEYKFERLKLLSLNKLNIRRWEASSDSFPNLKGLILKYCYDLKEIPRDFGEICTLESIELHECSKAAEDSARKIEQDQEDMENNFLKFYKYPYAGDWSVF